MYQKPEFKKLEFDESNKLYVLMDNFIKIIETTIIKEFIRIKFNKIQGLKDKLIKKIIQKSKIDDDSLKDFIEETKIKEPVRVFIEQKINIEKSIIVKREIINIVENINNKITDIDRTMKNFNDVIKEKAFEN